MTNWPIRRSDPADLAPLAALWHDGWHEAHAAHVPATLTAMRKPESFGRRLDGYGDALRVAGPIGSPLGLCTIRDDELDQIFVAPGARGTPLASALLRDGEQRMAVSGVGLAHLLCVQQNTRAAAFYRREGWQFRETSRQPVQTEAGPFLFDLLVFEKRLLPINSEFNKIQC